MSKFPDDAFTDDGREAEQANAAQAPAPASSAGPEGDLLEQMALRFPNLVFRTLAMPVVLVLLAIGFHFFLRGHNAPGGGFIAGLITAVAALLARMARDRQLLTVSPRTLVPLGLLVAAITGIVPMLLGQPFLKSAYGYAHLPLFGEIEWATAVAFDAGVLLVVIGTTLTIIDLLAEDGQLLRLGRDTAAVESPATPPADSVDGEGA